MSRPAMLSLSLLFLVDVRAATTQRRYYAHEAVHDAYGVIAPWYNGPNGQIDYRIRIAAETLKRYPWTPPGKAPRQLPEYMWSGAWKIDKDGKITIPPINDWANGDLVDLLVAARSNEDVRVVVNREVRESPTYAAADGAARTKAASATSTTRPGGF